MVVMVCTSDNVQLLIDIRGITESLEVVEEVASPNSAHGIATGKDLFLIMPETTKELELPWIKLKRVTTDGLHV
jgi:hypothetical protein